MYFTVLPFTRTVHIVYVILIDSAHTAYDSVHGNVESVCLRVCVCAGRRRGGWRGAAGAVVLYMPPSVLSIAAVVCTVTVRVTAPRTILVYCT